MREKELVEGILNWYPFSKNSVIDFTGKRIKELPKVLVSRGFELIFASKQEKVDCLVVFEDLEKADPIAFLYRCKERIKSNGHLFLIVENRLGLRYFCGDRDSFTDRNFDGIEGYRNFTESDWSYFGGRHYARYEIEEMLDQAGITHRRFYSVLPGLEMPQQIYAEDYYPEEELAIRYTPLYHNPSTVFLNEERLYTSLIKNGMFHQMANAYLIDCSMDGNFYEFNHVTTSMDRGPTDAMATIIRKDGFVDKKALYPEGIPKIQALIENMNRLQQHGIHVVPMELNDSGDGVVMPYYKCETALTYLRRLIYEDKDRFIEEVDRYFDCILRSSEVNEAYEGNPELGPYYQEVYIDMVPLNCFYQDGKYVFFDQEFCERNYPIKVVLVRSLEILYMADKGMEAIVPQEYWKKKYELEEKYNMLSAMGSKYIQELRHYEELVDFHKKHLADTTVINSNRLRMNYAAEEYQRIFVDYMADAEGKKIYLFGSGQWARKFIAEYGDLYQICGALDNRQEVWGKQLDGVEIWNPEILAKENSDQCKVIVCIKYYTSVLVQLRKLGITNYGIYDPYLERPTPLHTIETQVKRNQDGEDVKTEVMAKKYKVGYIAGVFDLFHVGHLNMFRRAKEQCEYLIVGVVSDEQASQGKAHSPYVNEKERLEIVSSNQYVDQAFILPIVSSGTRDVYKKYHFDVQFSGSDYEHDPGWLSEQAWLRERGSDLVFFPYTQSTSSTKLKQAIERNR